MIDWDQNVSALSACLHALSVWDDSGKEIDPDRAFFLLKAFTLKIKEQGGRIYLIGNGASASMASHIATDLAKNVGVHAEVFTDLALITALANDLCYEEVFAEPLRRRMKPGDMLVAISSSGQSPNILRAAQEAAKLEGFVVTLSGMKPNNALKSLGNLNFYVKADTYGLAETCHASILHFWVDLMLTAI
jgi:D-sedoheptulose 7-phosphate isomerase